MGLDLENKFYQVSCGSDAENIIVIEEIDDTEYR